MSYDDEWTYDDGPVEEQSRVGMYWVAGVTLAILSLIAGYLLGGPRHDDKHPAAQVAAESTASSGGDSSASSPSDSGSPQSASPTASESPSQSASVSSSTGALAKPDAELIAAINAAGDVVLADPDDATLTRTLVPAAAGTPMTDPSIAWDAAHGVVYFTRTGCTVWRHDIASKVTEQFAPARRVAVSPDGRYLALWTCGPGVGDLAVTEIASRKTVLSVPLTTAALDAGGAMSELTDMDWRPDSAAVVVTEGWEGDDVQYLITLAKPPKSVQKAPQVPVKGVNGSYYAVEYVGTQLVLAGTCCPPDQSTSNVVLRDRKTGAATKIAALSDIGLVRPTADAQSRLRYLRTSGGAAGAMWALDTLDGVPREVGGEFTAIDW